MARGDQKRRLRELARQEAAKRHREALEDRDVDARLHELLVEARAEIDLDEGEPVYDDGHAAELLYLEPDVDLRRVPFGPGDRFRFRDQSEVVWIFELSETQLQTACDGSATTISMTRETWR